MSEFKKSSFSNPRPPDYGGCVFVSIEDAGITVRKNEEERVLHFTHDEWKVFIQGVKNGEFDV